MKTIQEIATNQISPGNNDRTQFDRCGLEELAASISAYGLAQPITVRPNGSPDTFQIVAGERRFRAISEILRWPTIPAIVRPLTDEEASAIMLAENMARADLDPIDEANAYQSRIDKFGWTVSECADKAGVSPVRVRFRLKLLKLRPDVQKLIRDEQLALGYAQILADADLDANRQLIAIRHMRDNPKPTPSWFRNIVNLLLEQQAQVALFDLPILTGNIASSLPPAAAPEPPHPSTTKPPKTGRTFSDMLKGQIAFWSDAAQEWDTLGKPFKRQECEAAAQALQLALSSI